MQSFKSISEQSALRFKIPPVNDPPFKANVQGLYGLQYTCNNYDEQIDKRYILLSDTLSCI